MTERYVPSIQDRRTGTVSRLSEQVIKSNEHGLEGGTETGKQGKSKQEGRKGGGWTGYCEGSLSSNSIPRSNSPTRLVSPVPASLPSSLFTTRRSRVFGEVGTSREYRPDVSVSFFPRHRRRLIPCSILPDSVDEFPANTSFV